MRGRGESIARWCRGGGGAVDGLDFCWCGIDISRRFPVVCFEEEGISISG